MAIASMPYLISQSDLFNPFPLHAGVRAVLTTATLSTGSALSNDLAKVNAADHYHALLEDESKRWKQWFSEMVVKVSSCEEQNLLTRKADADALTRHCQVWVEGSACEGGSSDGRNQNFLRGGVGRLYEVNQEEFGTVVPQLTQACLKR